MSTSFARRVVAFASMALLIAADSTAGETSLIGEDSEIGGPVADIHDSTQSSGFRFSVALRAVQYEGQKDRTLLEQHEDGSLTIWVAFRDIQLTIGQISLSGQPGSATCGPLAMRIGHQREIWVAFDFDHQSDVNQTLKLSGSRCRIADDNWLIGSPAWVRTSGFFMTESKVINGVRSGLAGKRARIEQELQRIAYAELGESCTESGDVPADRSAFEAAVRARLVEDGHLSDVRPATGSIPVPLTGFTQAQPTASDQE